MWYQVYFVDIFEWDFGGELYERYSLKRDAVFLKLSAFFEKKKVAEILTKNFNDFWITKILT